MTLRVKELVLGSFKGQSDRHAVTPLNLLVGPNGGGKTTWWDALWFAIRGETRHGKRPSDAIAYSSGTNGFHVGVVLDDGYKWGRGVKLDDDGNPKQWLNLPGNPNLADAAAAVRAHCGDFPATFDLGVFLDLSADKQREYLVGLASQAAGGEGGDIDTLATRISRLAHENLPQTHNVALLQAQPLVAAAMSTASPDTLSRLSAGLACAKKLANDSKAAHTAATNSVRELSQQQSGLDLPTEPVDEMERRLETMRADSDEKIRVIFLRRGVDISRNAMSGQLETALGEADRLRQEQHDHGKVDVSGWLTQATELEAKAEGLEQHPKPMDSTEAWVKLDAMLDDVFDGDGVQQTKHWLAIREFVRVQWNAGEALRDWESAQSQARDLRGKADTHRKCLYGNEEKMSQLATAIALETERAAELKTKLADIDQAITDHTPLETLEAQRDGLAGQIASLEELLKRKRAAGTLQASLQTARENAEQQKTANEVAKALCAAIRKVREEHMGELVTRIVGPINRFLEIAAPGKEAYCKLQKPNGQPMFELGWDASGDGDCVSFDALSGGEAALFGVGLSLALLDLANPPLRLLLVEAGALDGENLPRVLQAIEATAERFQVGNAIVMTHFMLPTVAGWDPWNVVQV